MTSREVGTGDIDLDGAATSSRPSGPSSTPAARTTSPPSKSSAQSLTENPSSCRRSSSGVSNYKNRPLDGGIGRQKTYSLVSHYVKFLLTGKLGMEYSQLQKGIYNGRCTDMQSLGGQAA
jgi:hypothetical protein